MADSTKHESELGREEFANVLRELAREFEKEGDVDVEVGNKSVRLRPSKTVKYEIEAVEQSSVLRGDKESIELEARWKANK